MCLYGLKQQQCVFLYMLVCRFAEEVNSGLIEVISPSPYYYPDFTKLKETFGDSKERVQ